MKAPDKPFHVKPFHVKPLHVGRPEVGQLPVEEDVRKELAFHLDLRAAELEADGWDRAAARQEAERLFGDRPQLEEECRKVTYSTDRAVRRAHRFESVRQDLKYAVRTLARSPGFAAVAILTLALGIGANTAIFSVVNGVLLRPLPFSDPGTIVWLEEHQPERGRSMSIAWPNFVDWKEQNRTLSHLVAFSAGPTTVTGDERPFRAVYAAVTEDFWRLFQIRPLQGRFLDSDEHAAGGPLAVVIREDLWRSVYNSQPIDQIRMEVEGDEVPVVGVLSADFDFPAGTQIWGRLMDTGQSRSAHNFRAVGRLASGVTLAQADEELDAIQARLVQDEVDVDFIATGVSITTLREEIAGDARMPLLLLLGAAGVVLLVACTNLASTMLARGALRTKELAVRSAMGAARGRVVRQLLTESFLLSAMGGVGGLVLAVVLIRGLKAAGPTSVPRLGEVGLDPRVLVFAGFAVILTTALFGLLPAFSQTKASVATTLRSAGRQNSGRSNANAWGVLVGSEVALAFLLLTGSGLLIRSFRAVLATDGGFQTEGVMTVNMSLSQSRYQTKEDHRDFYDQLLPALAARPEIDAVGLVTRTPLTGAPNGRVELDGDASKQAIAVYLNASGGYFNVMGIDLLRGRTFGDQDREDTEHVAIVSAAFAEEYWPGEDPIGRTLTGGGMDSFWQQRRFARVVGVVADASYRSLESKTGPTAYFPYTQRPQRLRFASTIVARTDRADPSALVGPIRLTIETVDSDALPRFRAMEEVVGATMASRVFTMSLLAAFAGLALVLAIVGIYGVVSYTVASRTREMGIRLALGALPSQVGALVRNSAMHTVVLGAIAGLVASLALTRVLGSLLFGVDPIDAITLLGVGTVLVAGAWLASSIPAHKATRVDPMVTMQGE